MPLFIYKKFNLGDLKLTMMQLLMVDRTVKRPIGILYDVIVEVESFIFPTDFVILDCKVYFEILIILGRLFFSIGISLVDIEKR